jgi:hypothetical protein
MDVVGKGDCGVSDVCALLYGNDGAASAELSKHRPWRRLRIPPVTPRVAVPVVAGAIVIAAVAVGWPAERERRREACAGNLKTLGVAFHAYHNKYGHFPPAALTSKDGKPLLSWRVALLPYLGHAKLYGQFRQDEAWDSPHNLRLLAQMPSVYGCPSESSRRSHTTVYQAVVGPKPDLGSIGTMFEPTRGVEIREVTDGTSITLLIAESARAVPWTKPDDQTYDRDAPLPRFASRHPIGFNVLLVDGSVRRVGFQISALILRGLLTRDGGEVVSA